MTAGTRMDGIETACSKMSMSCGLELVTNTTNDTIALIVHTGHQQRERGLQMSMSEDLLES